MTQMYMVSFNGILEVQYTGQQNKDMKTTEHFCGYNREPLGMAVPADEKHIFGRAHFQSKVLPWIVARNYVGYNAHHGTSTRFIPLYTPIKTGDLPRRIWYVPQMGDGFYGIQRGA